MRLAVFDTNVIISAGIKPDRAPATLVMDWVLDGRIQIVTSPTLIEEYRTVVQRKKFSRYGFPPHWLEFMIEESLRLPDPSPWPHAGPDPEDLSVIALAHAAGAWLVTGNLKHYPESIRNGVKVITPSDYLSHLTEAKAL